MPRALEPGITFDVVLDSDKDKPEDSRPTFIFRSLSCREWAKCNGFYERLDGKTCETVVDELLAAVSLGLTGWRNLGIQFDASRLGDIVTVQEARELLDKCVRGNVPDADEKKS